MSVSRFILQNIAARAIGQKIPPYWLFRKSMLNSVDPTDYNFDDLSDEELIEDIKTNALGVPMMFPLQLKSDTTDWWLLPYEPVLTITGKNIIAKRQVAKGNARGSIKERWTQDDYQITVDGILMGDNNYPKDDVLKLRRLCEGAKVQVDCPLFEIFGITQMVIDSYEFPATTGRSNQAYRLTCSSDDIYKILLKSSDMQL